MEEVQSWIIVRLEIRKSKRSSSNEKKQINKEHVSVRYSTSGQANTFDNPDLSPRLHSTPKFVSRCTGPCIQAGYICTLVRKTNSQVQANFPACTEDGHQQNPDWDDWFPLRGKGCACKEIVQYRGYAGESEAASCPIELAPVKEIRLISWESMTLVSDVKLIRTNTTLDLRQKAEKGILVDGISWKYLPHCYSGHTLGLWVYMQTLRFLRATVLLWSLSTSMIIVLS